VIDIYWILALINAGLRSREANPNGLIAFPSRLMGLLLFVCCFSFEVYAFGNAYYGFKSGFIDQVSSKPIAEIRDAYFLSLGTMTTVDIVSYSAITKPAKDLKAYQVISNLIMFFSIFPILIARFSSFKDRLRNQGERLLSYDSEFNNKPFNAAAIEVFTGLTPNEWCEFSGLFELRNPPVKKEDFVIGDKYPNLELKVDQTSTLIYMAFNLDKKNITIKRFVLEEKYKHHSSKIWRCITTLAAQSKFQKIEINIEPEELSSNQICLTWEKESGVNVDNDVKNHVESVKNSDGSDNDKTFYEIIAEPSKLAEWTEKRIAWKATWIPPNDQSQVF
jgi:hypothetical protein